jgi:hypothetical protein
MVILLKIAGQEHLDRHNLTESIKQWRAPAVDIQRNQLFHTHLHQFYPWRLWSSTIVEGIT